jgi:hypothetical protein
MASMSQLWHMGYQAIGYERVGWAMGWAMQYNKHIHGNNECINSMWRAVDVADMGLWYVGCCLNTQQQQQQRQ